MVAYDLHQTRETLDEESSSRLAGCTVRGGSAGRMMEIQYDKV